MSAYSIVIPTIGRPSLRALMATLDAAHGPLPERIVIVDDRTEAGSAIDYGTGAFDIASRAVVLRSGGVGPAAARNIGWRATETPWICFVDDDVLLTHSWCEDLARDLASAREDDAGICARVSVPLPSGRPPTDWERNVASLARSSWITADMAYRREALERVDGFDARFPRAYREDADLALRVRQAGYTLRTGERRAIHPVRPADAWISVRLQRGNADDALMRALHGPHWRERAQCPPGRFNRHVATVASATIALAGALAWLAFTAEFAWRRIAPGPKDAREIAAMTTTSAVIPFAAVYHRLRGEARARSMRVRAS